MIELTNISKTYPSNGANALDNANFFLRNGEIHALFGENGAGKSTFMRIMAGWMVQDAGKIALDGHVTRFSSPAKALRAGIGMVAQHPLHTPGFSVWEACVLGAEPYCRLFFRKREARASIERLNKAWKFALDIDSPTEMLDAAGRQKAAIMSLLLRNVRYMIFDEPTAALNKHETEQFFRLFTALGKQGNSLVIISHKLQETLTIADTVTVLRKGKTAATLPAADCTEELIVDLMFEKNLSSGSPPDHVRAETTERQKANAILAVHDLSVDGIGKADIGDINFTLHSGHITGIAGIKESGTETLELALSGFLGTSSGRITLNGTDITGKGDRAFRNAGGAYLGMGVLNGEGKAVSTWDAALSIRDNLLIHSHRRFNFGGILGNFGFLDTKKINKKNAELLQLANLHVSAGDKARTLSGGMLQRLLTFREFSEEASLIILSEPGWGLDHERRQILFDIIKEKAAAEVSILLFLSNVDDILDVCNDVIVLLNGKVSLSLNLDDGFSRAETKARIQSAMFKN